jgi:hypothetical protein
MAHASICTALGVDCSRCNCRAVFLKESKAHYMQWPEDILDLVWKKVRSDVLPRLKARLWRDVHYRILWEYEGPGWRCDNEYEGFEGFGVPMPTEQEQKRRQEISPACHYLEPLFGATRVSQKVVIFY